MDDLELEIDFGGTIDELERGGKCTAPGWYSAVVEDVARKNDEKIDLVFQVAAGPWKGSCVWESLYLPGYSNDPKKEKNGLKKLGMAAQRLGLWDGQSRPMRANWVEAIGKPVVIEVARRSYTDASGADKEIVGLTFAGIYPPDHPKIPDEVRKRLGLPPARAEKGEDAPGQTQLFVPPPPASSAPPEFANIPNAAARRQAVDLSDL